MSRVGASTVQQLPECLQNSIERHSGVTPALRTRRPIALYSLDESQPVSYMVKYEEQRRQKCTGHAQMVVSGTFIKPR